MASRIADSMLLFMGPHQRSIPSYRVGPHCSPGMLCLKLESILGKEIKHQKCSISTKRSKIVQAVAIPVAPSPIDSAEYRKQLAESYGFEQIGEPLPENVTLRDVIDTIPKKVFEIDDVKAWKSVLISATSYALGLFMISKAPWYLLPLAWAWTGTAVTGFFVIGHDCAHKSFSRNKLLEDIVGTLAFLPLIYPYEPWRFKHDRHHAKTNMLSEDTAWHPVLREEFDSSPTLRKAIIYGYGPIRPWMSIAHWLIWHFDLNKYRPNGMNPPPPSLRHHSFTFLPQNPNTNMLNTVTPNPDLTSTLSALKALIHQSETAVTSPHNLLHHHCSAALSPCPFDPRHRMPPEFLFRHHLRCPSSHFPPLDPSILQSLRYPRTLQSQSPNSFLQPLRDSNSELCFSLDQFGDFGSNFFYRDCPGVVELDRLHRTLTLPGLLSVECANFVGVGDDGRIGGASRECVRLLPSELWEFRREIGLWNDFPSSYSYAVLRVVLCAEMVKEGDFLKWVIANSPWYGVVIDVAMRDHIFVLFRLVLKAIVREAISWDVKGKGLEMNSKTMSLECPNLVQAMMWLASQISVLYGEANGKFFAINMLKQCLFNVASGLVLFALEENVSVSPASKQVSGNVDADVNNIRNAKLEPPQMGTEYDERAIFVSQVAAAVAALHERSLLEQKIKSLRLSQPIPRYQLMAEHACLTARADEERKNNPNYKPILEHDGLLWQRSRNQESSKTRTREELLAEERDYKRRRMSYRGKKLKQTTTEVMRDIIEEYMEEIKQAGGIGCSVKGAEEGNVPPSKLLSSHDSSTDTYELEKIMHTSSESRGGSQDLRKELPSDYKVRSTRSDDSYSDDHEQHRRVSHGYDGNLEYHKKSFSRDKHDREYNPRSSERNRSDGRSHEQTRHRSKRGDAEVTRVKQHELSSSMPKYRDNRAFSSVSKRVNDSTMERDDRRSEAKDRWQRKSYGNNLSESMVQNSFDDRYDPSAFDDILENDISS